MTAVISENAEKILKTRYLTNGESIDEMFRRVSLGNDKYYRLMRELKFLPNSPTLFNAGLKNGCTLSACFTADTVIHTLAGDFTVAELLERGDKEFEVFSTNGRRLKIGRAFALRQTKSNAKVYRVTFDTGDSIKLTADHLVMMRDVSYKEVRHLKEGDSVMPFNHGREKGRRYVFKRIDSGYTLAYQWAFKQKTGRTVKRGCEVHHVNLDKTDDRTTNLVEMSESDHKRLHRLGDLNPMKKPEVAAKISEQMMGNQRGVGPKPGTAEAMIGNQHALRTEPHPDKRKQYQREWARKKSRERRGLYNHKVVSVEYVGREDVYDLSVHKYHNFAANGIFIHNCFVFDIEDSMFGKNSIVETRAKAIAVAKAGGGVGYYFGKLRPKDSLIKSVHRKACGPVAVLRDMHGVRQLITQGGKRDLAQMGVLNVEHENIRDFIHCKDEDPKALESFNLSVGWSDRAVYQAFVEADDQGEYYHKLWREQCESAWKTGCPGMLFPDVINKFNPNKHLGLINATNPCGETPNRSDEPCLTGDALIETPKGMIRLADLLHKGQFSVTTYDQVTVPGCRAVTQGKKPVLQVRLSSGQSVRCTTNHRILTDRGWVKAEDLVVGDMVKVADRQTTAPVLKESAVDEMLGWQVGDGWYSKPNQIGILFSADDKEAMDRLMPVWDDFVEKDYTPQFQEDGGVVMKSCYRTAVLEKFNRLGFTVGRATEKRLPTYIFTASPHRQLAFLRGLFSADGSVNMSSQGLRNGTRSLVNLNASSRVLLDEVQILLLRYGIQSRIWTTKFTGDNAHRNDQSDLQISGESAVRFMKVVGFNLSKKQAAFTGPAKMAPRKNRKFFPVTAIEEVGEEVVYDILMPEKHHFLANGIVVHNCNLGSQSIARYIDLKTRKFRREEFLADTYTCTLFLDDILDANEFPHPDIEAAALLTRKLGLGIMGWADFLSLQGIQYDSPEALLLADSIMKDVKEVNLKARRDRAKEKGPYKGWSDLSEQEMLRNETGTSIAPTGTIAIIADVWGSIEPYFMFDGERTTFEGIKMNDGVPQWVRERLDGFVPKTAAQITPADHVRMQAAFQKHVDLGVSKTVNLPNSASVKDVSDTYKLMHDLGCKGGTIYRDGCRAEQVLRAKSTKTSVYLSVDAGGGRRHLPATRTSKTHKFTIDNVRGFLTVGEYQDGTPGELFLRFSKVGSTVSGMLDSWAMMVSLGLQHGVPLESIIRLNSGIRFEPAGLTGNKEVPVCSSIVDYVVRWMEREYLGPKPKDKTDSVTMSGQMCPDCGHELIYQAGCLSCIKAGCNWQKCG